MTEPRRICLDCSRRASDDSPYCRDHLNQHVLAAYAPNAPADVRPEPVDPHDGYVETELRALWGDR